MSTSLSKKTGTRRDFLSRTACASMGITGMVNCLAQMRLMNMAVAADPPSGMDDYKAMVCIFLGGGNDANNMMVPMGDPASDEARHDYEAARGNLVQPRAGLHPLNLPVAAPDVPTRAFQKHYGSAFPQLGIHPNARPLADLFNAGEMAFVANVGTLVYPIVNRAAFVNRTVPVPMGLYSHSDQQVQWQSSISDKPFSSGWGGRVADLVNAAYNQGGKISMSVAMTGLNSFQSGAGGGVEQYIIGQNGTVSLDGYGTNYKHGYNIPGDVSGGYKNTSVGRQLKAFEDIMRLTHDQLLEERYNEFIRQARSTEGVVATGLAAAAATGVNFDSHFANAQSPLGDCLKMAARIIAGRTPLGNRRQVFFIYISGYDNHAGMLGAHATLMNTLSQALLSFRNTLKDPALNVFDKVVTFTASDFARTLLSNGSGSDHAWGSHSIVMGGGVKGRNLYGHYPALKLGDQSGSIDSHSGRGLLIPDVSVDQYAAVLANWFGVQSSAMEAILPNLPHFDNPLTTSTANLAMF